MTGYLLDTHALIWWNLDDARLGAKAREVIEAADGPIFVSAVSVFEIANKHRLGKLPVAEALLLGYRASLEAVGFVELAITTAHALHAGALQIPHRDPFDRLLIAQTQLEGLTLVSNEKLFDGFGITRLWN